MIWTVTKKELRGYFNSAVAVIFLAAFLVVAMYTFFWREKFFARGLADLRPLFEWMPKLLIIIVSALAMRLWAEEKRTGTLEVLLTLPIPRWKLVVGKFVAGLMLIAVALGLTLGLPITIAQMGSLDPGPVFGGYLAALLLSGAYLSIGMCVSAATDNQIVAFVGTAFLCGIAYAIGGDGTSELGRFLGTGARFESVARGVLDLRDLAYYGSIIAIGISINVLLLERATRSSGPRARPKRIASLVTVALVVANSLLLNVWLAPVYRARIDLTKDGSYSLSSSTRNIITNLDEKLIIRGYFSEQTHPKLAPLIPQVRDLFDEYRIAGRGNVDAEIVDPTDSPELKREAKDRFDIQPVPLPFATDTQRSVVSSYFAIAIQYGDQHVVIPLGDLIAQRRGVTDVEVTLRNPEYTITKAVKKLVAQFSSVDSLFAGMNGKAQLYAIITSHVPKSVAPALAAWKKVAPEISKLSAGKLDIVDIAPTDEQVLEMRDKYKVQPQLAADESGRPMLYYFRFVLQIGGRKLGVPLPAEEITEANLKKAITEAIRKAAPGFTRVVGLWSPPAPQADPMMAQMGRPPRRPQSFDGLRESLNGTYDVRDVDLAQRIPDDVDLLLLGGPADLDAKAVEHVDQFVMRGGALVVLAGRQRFKRMAPRTGIELEKVNTGLEAALAKWGVTLGDTMVRDPKGFGLPMPVVEDLGDGQLVESFRDVKYDTFLMIDGGQLSSSSSITSGLNGAVMPWSAPITAVKVAEGDNAELEELVRSSPRAWASASTQVTPDFRAHPDLGFAGPGEEDKQGEQIVGVAVRGSFPSALDKRTELPGKAAAGDGSNAGEKQTVAERSPDDTRIVVFGSSDFVSDLIMGLADDIGADFMLSNRELVQNAVDWALADTDLLAIRSRNSAARALTVDVDERTKWRNINLGLASMLLTFVVGAAAGRRRTVKSVMEGR
ncbi:MAG: Gldg family protein [Deltaproteobacteria bacterium]|nr:Gldg family protein [Deltaproteobacteria bacterium]